MSRKLPCFYFPEKTHLYGECIEGLGFDKVYTIVHQAFDKYNVPKDDYYASCSLGAPSARLSSPVVVNLYVYDRVNESDRSNIHKAVEEISETLREYVA